VDDNQIARIHDFEQSFRAVVNNVEKVVHGKTEVVEQALVCLFAGGHLLVEDVPGVGKTTLARCVAASLEASCNRIQFTPDLLPSDVTGVTLYNQKSGEFDFHPGPIFANIVLADEVNRASPKTQSALLEVMEEHRVTIDAVAHPVPSPFTVVATQNPVDMDGTYALPEAQLDRFLMRLSVGYPHHSAEVAVLRGRASAASADGLDPVLSVADVTDLIETAAGVHVADAVFDYVVHLVDATRKLPDLRLGASPRGSIALLRSGRVRAASLGRHYVTPDDVKALAVPVLAHRLLVAPDAELRGFTAEQAVADVLDTVPSPGSLVGV
jgi:MoxR-like ATPase